MIALLYAKSFAVKKTKKTDRYKIRILDRERERERDHRLALRWPRTSKTHSSCHTRIWLVCMFIYVLSIVLSFLSFYSLSLSIPAPANEAAAHHRCTTWARFFCWSDRREDSRRDESSAQQNKRSRKKKKKKNRKKKMHESFGLNIFVNRGWCSDMLMECVDCEFVWCSVLLFNVL